jgi:hypothetical protein
VINHNIKKIKEQIIHSSVEMKLSDIHPHEQVLEKRANGLLAYVNSLKPWIVLPSIIICKDTNVIIDGHHRFYILKKLKYDNVFVDLLDYSSDLIVTHNNPKMAIRKSDIINSGIKKSLLRPKSSLHHLKLNKKNYPIILLSQMILINESK